MKMNRMVVKSTVSSDGVLHLALPIGIEEANKEVQVTVESALPVPVAQEEWQELILSTAGKWQGEFERPEQGEYEEREPLP
jgi:hypothetical protein